MNFAKQFEIKSTPFDFLFESKHFLYAAFNTFYIVYKYTQNYFGNYSVLSNLLEYAFLFIRNLCGGVGAEVPYFFKKFDPDNSLLVPYF